MTDQPNPVGLKKEISGHPTDHSRKALDLSTWLREKIAYVEDVETRGVLEAMEEYIFQICAELLSESGIWRVPSLPEEGGRLSAPVRPAVDVAETLAAALRKIANTGYSCMGWHKADMETCGQCSRCIAEKALNRTGMSREAGASTLGER